MLLTSVTNVIIIAVARSKLWLQTQTLKPVLWNGSCARTILWEHFLDWGNLISVCGGGVTQVLGSVGGVLAVMKYMPQKYRQLIAGPSLKVSLHTGALAEGVLTFVITFVVLLIMIRGPRRDAAKTLLMAISTVVLITVGASYTGPAMNPAFVSDYYCVPQLITNWCLIVLHLFAFLYT